MAAMVYENEAAIDNHYEGIPCSNFSKRTQDGRAADGEDPHDYDKLQRRPKCERCGNISRRALIVGFLVAIVVTNVAVGMAVWHISRITGCGYPDEATCSLCLLSPENNRTSTNGTKKVCEADWEYHWATDYCYRAFTDPLAFFEAEKHCILHGAHLASSRSREEQIIVKGILHNQNDTNGGLWLGGNDVVQEGVWTWVDGEPIGPWQPWHPGQPDDYWGVGGEDCMEIRSSFTEWNDRPCSNKYIFICSKAAPTCPPPDAASDASLIASDFHHLGSVATYTCSEGYTHSSVDLNLTCQADSQWSGVLPVCSEHCTLPMTVSNAGNTPELTYFLIGAQLTYTCDSGYSKASGDLVRICMTGNTWSGTAPRCDGRILIAATTVGLVVGLGALVGGLVWRCKKKADNKVQENIEIPSR